MGGGNINGAQLLGGTFARLERDGGELKVPQPVCGSLTMVQDH